MQLSLTFVALLGAIASSFAAPLAGQDSALASRGLGHHLRQKLHEWHDKHTCHKRPVVCYRDEEDFNIKTIKEIGSTPNFFDWKKEIVDDRDSYYSTLREAELRAGIDLQAIAFNNLMNKMQTQFYNLVAGLHSTWYEYELKYQIAYIYWALPHIKHDIREALYGHLVAFVEYLTRTYEIEYTAYPKTCDAVLVQLETIEKYHSDKIEIKECESFFRDIHETIYKATTVDKETVTETTTWRD